MEFIDRVSAYPNRYIMTDGNGNASHVYLERADDPTVPGTPLNAETFNEMLNEMLPLSGGEMTGDLDMGGKKITNLNEMRVSLITPDFINGAKMITRGNKTSEQITTKISRGGSCVFFVAATTVGGCSAYLVNTTQGSTDVQVIKLCGEAYSDVGFSCEDTRTLTIHLTKYAHCFIISADTWQIA